MWCISVPSVNICLHHVLILQHNSKEITEPWYNCLPRLLISACSSFCLFCLLSSCSFSKLLPPASFILQSCHFSVLSRSFISFASFTSFLYLLLCLSLFVLHSNFHVFPFSIFSFSFISFHCSQLFTYIFHNILDFHPLSLWPFYCTDQFQCLSADASLFKF